MDGKQKSPQDALDHEFANSTTCHGASRIANAKNRPHMTMWTLVFLAAFGLCTWQVSDRIRASGVSINDQLYLGAAFYIPTLVGDPEALNAYLNGVDWDSFGASAELLGDYAGYTRRNGFVLDNSTLLECFWRGRPCYAENFTHVFTTYGNCWTFNGDKNSPLKQTTPGAGNGLKMTLDILTYKNEPSPWGQCDPKKGQNYLDYYDTYTLPGCLLECRAKLVESCGCRPMYYPGDVLKLFDIYVMKRPYKNEPSPWGQCDPKKGQNYLDYYDTYTLPGCLLECRAKLVESCGCRPMYYPGDVGGQLGFFIGVSVITLFEFFEYLVMKFLVFACYSKMESETEKPDREQSTKENSSVPPENKGALATELQTMPKTQKGLAEIQVS
uniref:Uncharacterized protein n=1 Tax=Branchiostoma floridae TaxID=7739 RepID=C3XW92_BRAFL|eukprot:XP_002611616.1 hypothetical protein BRAFLDRAFT_63735 [Branchiostoma floridae]